MGTFYKALLRDKDDNIIRRMYGTRLCDVEEIVKMWTNELIKDGCEMDETIDHNNNGDWFRNIFFFKGVEMTSIHINNYSYIENGSFYDME